MRYSIIALILLLACPAQADRATYYQKKVDRLRRLQELRGENATRWRVVHQGCTTRREAAYAATAQRWDRLIERYLKKIEEAKEPSRQSWDQSALVKEVKGERATGSASNRPGGR